MDFEKIIDNVKRKTSSMIKEEDWINLTLIFEKEPNQIFYFSELIEQQIKKILFRQEDIFEPIPKNPSYYRFKTGIEFVLKLIRAKSSEFTPEFRETLCETLFPKLKEEIGYYSNLDLFFKAFHSEILNKFLEKTLDFPHILKKLIRNDYEKIKDFYPLIYNKDEYQIGYLFIKEQPNLLSKYESESIELIKNIIIGENHYKELVQLLKDYNSDLIPILENRGKSLKKTFLKRFLTSQKDSFHFNQFSKSVRIFDFSLDLFSDEELSAIVRKIIELGFVNSYEDNNTNWMHLILLEIAWHKKVDLFQEYLVELVELNYLQVLESYFLQRPEKIKESTNFIIENLGFFAIDLLERRYTSFDISDPLEIFKKVLEKNKNYYNKVIQVFFKNNSDYVLNFKQILLSKLKDIISKRENEDISSYYYISGLLDYIYYYYPKYKLDIDKDLINELFDLILNNSNLAEHLNYVRFLRNNINLLRKPIQTKFLSQLIKNECIPCIEYYIQKNLEAFSQNIDGILSYQPRDEIDSDNYIRPLEYILRKKYDEDKELVRKILNRIEELIASKRKAEIFLVVNQIEKSLRIYDELIKKSLIIPHTILKFLDFYLVQIESTIEVGNLVDIFEIQDFIERIDLIFNNFNSSDLREREFNIKKNCLEARLELYNGFLSLQKFEYNIAQEKFLKAFLLYKELSEIDDKIDYNIDLFKINSKSAYFFKENISSISKFLEKDDVESANKFIQKNLNNITYSRIKSNFQLDRHINSLRTLEFNKESKIISQFKSESPINFCSSPPKVISKRILDENGNIIIEWDNNDILVKLGTLLVSKKLKKYFLEVRFENRAKAIELSPEIKTSKSLEVASISKLKIKAGISSYKISLKSENSNEEENIVIILTEKNICGFQIVCQILINIRNQEEVSYGIVQLNLKSFDDFFIYHDSIIKKLVEKLSLFNHIEGKRINKDSIIAWLKQFGTLKRARLALNILNNVDFYDRNRLRSCFEWLYNKYISNKENIISNLGNSRDSSAIMNNIVSGDFLMDESPPKHLKEILNQENPEQVSIVFFDDIIQSGKQARSIFQEWFGLTPDLNEHHVEELHPNQKEMFKKFHIYLFFAYGFEKGIKNLNSLLKELMFSKFSTISFYNDNNRPFKKCFHPTSRVFHNPRDRLLAEEMCKDIGYHLFSDKINWSEEKRQINSLGYGNEQRLFVSFWNVPTTTLPILWKRGNYNNKIWEPLFSRREKK